MKKLEWLSFMLQKKILGRSDVFVDGKLYMRRWLFGPAWAPGLRIHNIVKSDASFELHDHPFDFVSLILTGGYCEIRGEGAPGVLTASTPRRKVQHPPLSVVVRKAEDFHRILLNPTVIQAEGRQVLRETPAWTLVLRGPIRREWGFLCADGWKHWTEYVTRKGQLRTGSPFAVKSST